MREAALRGWTNTELGRQVSVSRSTIDKLATQPKPPLPATVLKIADALGIPRGEALELAGVIPGTASAAIPKPSVSAAGEVAAPAGEAELDAFGAMLTREYPEFADLVESLRSEPSLTAGEKLGLMTMARILRQARGDANDRSA